MTNGNSKLLRVLRLPPGLRGEIALAGACLLVGLLLMPAAIWIVGRLSLGAYEHGSVLALLADYFRALARGAPVFWAVALGPYLLLLWLRFGLRLLRRN